MATLKLTPRNLPSIQNHFDKQLKETKKKLAAVNKKKVELERDLALFQDGAEWCAKVYQASKISTLKAKTNG